MPWNDRITLPRGTNGRGVHFYGGKNRYGLAHWILQQLPAHSTYVEPFLGSGSILRRKLPALRTIGLELDPTIIRWWHHDLRWPGASILQGCGIDWLEKNWRDIDEDWLVYCDPPYPKATRTRKRVYYREWDDDDHVYFLELIQELPCQVIVSTFPNDLYDWCLEDWHRQERRSYGISKWGTEVLYCNFDPLSACRPGLNSFVRGDSHAQRNHHALVARDWARKFKKSSADLRTAILSELLRAEQSLRAEVAG